MKNDIRHLIFVRHGESEHHTNGLTGGWTNTPLTRLGREQISAAATKLRDRYFSTAALYTSDLKRAEESARIIGLEINCEPVLLPELREINNGDAANLTLVQASGIQYPEPEIADLDWRPYDNAETWREMAARMASALTRMENNEAETTIVVGHGNSGQALILEWLGLPPDCRVSFNFDTASTTELRINSSRLHEIESLETTSGPPPALDSLVLWPSNPGRFG